MQYPGLFQDIDLLSVFRPVVKHLWTLWELVLVGEPIMIFSPGTPRRASDAVLGLAGLIAPLPFAADYRPFFTIYDVDFQPYRAQCAAGDMVAPAGQLIGCTNPMLYQQLEKWPTVAVLQADGAVRGKADLQPRQWAPVVHSSGGSWLQASRDSVLSSTVGPDVLRKLLPDSAGSGAINNALVRRHFQDLTCEFLAPLLPFVSAATAGIQGYPFAPTPALPVFSPSSFLEDLRPVGVFANLRRNRIKSLYRRFMEGPHFRSWFAQQRSRCMQNLRRFHGGLVVDFAGMADGLSSKQRVDALQVVQDLLQNLSQDESCAEHILHGLQNLRKDLLGCE